MKLLKAFIYTLLLAGVASSCEDVIDLDLSEGEKKLVVEGDITNRTPAFVKLSTTAAYFSNGTTPLLSGATVQLYRDGILIDTLRERIPGSGMYHSDTIGRMGSSYTIRIDIPQSYPELGGRTYVSLTETINRVPPIDTIYQRYIDDDPFDDEGYYVYFDTQEPVGVGDHYRWKYYVNSEFQDDPEYLFVREDRFVDGNYIDEFQINDDPVVQEDTVRVEQLSITREAYDFYNLVFQQSAQVGGTFDPPPAQIKGNIVNANNADDYALGFWSAAGMEEAELVVQ